MIPTQDHSDPTDPAAFAAWAYLAVPTHNGDVISHHPADAAAASEFLWKLGFRHHPDLQTHRLAIPGGSTASFMAASGADLVPVDEPPTPAETLSVDVPDLSGLSLEQRSRLLEQLRALGHGEHDTPPPSPPSSRAVPGPEDLS